jgi:hypothetical protein
LFVMFPCAEVGPSGSRKR